MPDQLFEFFVTSPGLNGQKGFHILVKNWILMIHSTKNYQAILVPVMIHQDQEVFWGKWALEAGDVSELAEATEVKEVSNGW